MNICVCVCRSQFGSDCVSLNVQCHLMHMYSIWRVWLVDSRIISHWTSSLKSLVFETLHSLSFFSFSTRSLSILQRLSCFIIFTLYTLSNISTHTHKQISVSSTLHQIIPFAFSLSHSHSYILFYRSKYDFGSPISHSPTLVWVCSLFHVIFTIT